ncbi:MAG TPA: sigma-70 family RNA polymerase sigma factor [Herpetosiphonaceae bacterium]|nr:sigma-70 family RNA polymerase sigma factor [Herpetosiphonaceae bacterium]
MDVALHHHLSPPLADPAAFEAVYQRYHRQIFRYAIALCGGCAGDAEDITAETFLRAWSGRARFAGSQEQALGWLLAIARHTLVDRRRLEKVERVSDALDDDLADLGRPLEEIVLRHADLQAVLAAVHTLPLSQREIFILRYVMDWKVKDIARQLSISENAASVALHRAMKHLRSILNAKEPDHGR